MKSINTLQLLTFIIGTLFFIKPTNSQVISYVDGNMNIIVEGQEFIPMGFYCEALPFDANPNLAQQIADGGFNFIYAESYIAGISDVEAYLNIFKDFLVGCDSLNIKVVNGLLWQSVSPILFPQYVDTLKQFSSIIAWNIMDDANYQAYSEVVNQKNQILALDQRRLNSISFASIEPPVPSMMPLADVAFIQSYPWGLESQGIFLNHSNYLFRNHVLSCQENGVVPVATPQMYNWDFETFPSAQHVDAQSYLAFITGMKGMIYYTFKDYDNNSTVDITYPAQFAAASKVADEVLNTELKEVVLHGEHEYHSIYQDKYYATWRYNNALYLIAVNTSADNVNSYEIPLPNDVTGNLINLFSDRPDSLSIQNGMLVGDLNPYQVAIYKMETTTSLEDLSKENVVRIAPNPVGDFMFIDGEINNGEIDIYDISGKLVMKASFKNKAAKIDVSKLKSGVYFVKLFSGAGQLMYSDFKMVKK